MLIRMMLKNVFTECQGLDQHDQPPAKAESFKINYYGPAMLYIVINYLRCSLAYPASFLKR